MRIQVKDFMSKPVITVTGKQRVSELRKLMMNKKIHAVPVIKYEKKLPELDVKIRGIVTNNDILRSTSLESRIEDIMTDKVHIIHQDSSAKAAANMMLKHGVHHLVVMNNGKITGIVSSMDFVKLVSDHSLT